MTKKQLEQFQKRLNSKFKEIYFKEGIKLIEDESCSITDYLIIYFNFNSPITYSNKECTIVQCRERRNRSLTDLYFIAKTKKGNLDVIEFVHIISEILTEKLTDIPHLMYWCGDIQDTMIYNTELHDYGCCFPKNSTDYSGEDEERAIRGTKNWSFPLINFLQILNNQIDTEEDSTNYFVSKKNEPKAGMKPDEFLLELIKEKWEIYFDVKCYRKQSDGRDNRSFTDLYKTMLSYFKLTKEEFAYILISLIYPSEEKIKQLTNDSSKYHKVYWAFSEETSKIVFYSVPNLFDKNFVGINYIDSGKLGDRFFQSGLDGYCFNDFLEMAISEIKGKLVLVYGSLKKGFHNHRLLNRSHFMKGGKIPMPFTMINLGAFPGLIPTKHRVEEYSICELYLVDDKTFKQLDLLEGYPNFYNRVLVDVGADQKAYVYILNEENGYKSAHKVENNNWLK